MSREDLRLPLLTKSAGTERFLTVHRYGTPGGGPKAYIQAALHADETPGLIVAHHLRRLLDEAAQNDEIIGEILLVPYANPIGLGQILDGRHLGRYDLGGEGNFNRNWPDIFAELAARLDGSLGNDAARNVATIRALMRELLAAREAASELDSLRLHLARLAVDADLVLDLHCDNEALMHAYILPAHWPLAEPLMRELGCHAVLTAEDSGGGAFDEAFSTLWTRLAARFPEHPIPPACFATTLELRGRADVSDAMAAADAEAILRSLRHYGLISGDPGPLPPAHCDPTPLDACEPVKSPHGGVVAYCVALGDHIAKGDIVAWILDPAAHDTESGRRPVHSATDGLVLTLRADRFVVPGQSIAKIVGKEALSTRQAGALLEP